MAQKAKAATPSYTANASKVIDENGEPLRVFHSTDFDGEIEVFDNDVVYFSKNRNFSGEFGKNTYEVFLNTRNPYNFDQTNGVYVARNGSIPKVEGEAVSIGWLDAAESTVADMQRRGFDGAIDGNGEFIVIFNPNQIKSTFNRGSFDDSGRILKSAASAEDASASQITPAPTNTKPGSKALSRVLRQISKDLKDDKVTLETLASAAKTKLDRDAVLTINPAAAVIFKKAVEELTKTDDAGVALGFNIKRRDGNFPSIVDGFYLVGAQHWLRVNCVTFAHKRSSDCDSRHDSVAR